MDGLPAPFLVGDLQVIPGLKGLDGGPLHGGWLHERRLMSGGGRGGVCGVGGGGGSGCAAGAATREVGLRGGPGEPSQVVRSVLGVINRGKEREGFSPCRSTTSTTSQPRATSREIPCCETCLRGTRFAKCTSRPTTAGTTSSPANGMNGRTTSTCASSAR